LLTSVPLIGIIAGAICFWACTWLKLRIGVVGGFNVHHPQNDQRVRPHARPP